MTLREYHEVYAVPGENGIIDAINPNTGLTYFCGSSATEVTAKYPGAVRMPWADWVTAASARQRTPIVWEPTTAAQYDEMLNILPPAMWIGGAFLVGEPTDHDVLTGAPRFTAYWQRGSMYYAASRPLMHTELRACLQAEG